MFPRGATPTLVLQMQDDNLDFRATPANAGTVDFAGLNTDCVIHVPVGSLTAYTSAANYPNPNTYTYVDDVQV